MQLGDGLVARKASFPKHAIVIVATEIAGDIADVLIDDIAHLEALDARQIIRARRVIITAVTCQKKNFPSHRLNLVALRQTASCDGFSDSGRCGLW